MIRVPSSGRLPQLLPGRRFLRHDEVRAFAAQWRGPPIIYDCYYILLYCIILHEYDHECYHEH